MQHLSVKSFPYLIISFICLLSFNDLASQKALSILSPTQLRSTQIQFEEFAKEKGYLESDFTNLKVTDAYHSGGVMHVYYQQQKNSIPILFANGAIHLKEGTKPFSNIKFARRLATIDILNSKSLSAEEALIALSNIKHYSKNTPFTLLNDKKDLVQAKVFENDEVSNTEIPVSLAFVQTSKTELKLAWDIVIDEVNGGNYYNVFIDAETGEILDEINWTINCNFGEYSKENKTKECDEVGHKHDLIRKSDKSSFSANFLMPNSYNVFPWPIESPNFGDRDFAIEPWLDNVISSPNGWHIIGLDTFTVTRGNNVDAYDDSNDTDGPTGGDDARADGGETLNFDFPWTVEGVQTTYKDAAITNLFYWANVTHDVWFNYGFDEASGNFQEENFTVNGAGSDGINCEAQDGSGTCNANMSTPPDGSNPTTQMYLCGNNGLDRDGDYDNGVVVHEYGHGISIRQTGGPANSSCLNNSEQMGEGWSDYFGMVMTIEPGDAGSDSRGMGTWLFGEGPDGDGIRPFPYSTDFNINPMTYATIGSGVSVPHGVGSVWCTMLWDMTWALIDEYGVDPDIYDGTGGNNIAMKLVNEGLKLQPCRPGFVDGRDAILQADELFFNGDNKCLIWEVFSNRGLGFSASQGNTGSVTDGNEAFDLPSFCTIQLEKTANINEGNPEDEIIYTLVATNSTVEVLNNVVISDTLPSGVDFVMASGGGTLNNGVVTWPSVSLAVNEVYTVNVKVAIDSTADGIAPNIEDDMEASNTNWNTTDSGSTSWNLESGTSNSGSNAWFANDGSSPGLAELILVEVLGITESTFLSFAHQYDTEATWDGGVVEISINQGQSWEDLGSLMLQNGYNSTIYNSRPGFSGNSNGFITTIIDLSSFNEKDAIIRFQMNCDQSVGGNGWWIDDVLIANLSVYIQNMGVVTNGEITTRDFLDSPTLVLPQGESISIALIGQDILCYGEETGSITSSVSGGIGLYNYNWSNGDTTPSINNLAKGTYFLTVSDGSQSGVNFKTISAIDSLDLILTATPEITVGSGAASIGISGGTAPYEILWSNGSTNDTISGVDAGFYSATVTDANLCSKIDSVEVISPFGDCGFRRITVQVQFDQWPEESSFQLINSAGDTVATAGPFDPEQNPDGSLFTDYLCLEPDCYLFIMSDVFGDGNCETYSNPPGYFALFDEQNNVLALACDIGFSDTLRVTFIDEPIVTNVNNQGIGSLREVISNACLNDTIYFDGNLLDQTITLTGPEITLAKPLAFKGLGMNNLTINGGGNSRVFAILDGVPIYIENVTLEGIQENPNGGAILNAGELTLKNVQVKK